MKELLEKLVNNETGVDEVLAAIEADTKDRVPRSRLNDKNDEIKELKEQLSQRDTQLESLKQQVKGEEALTTSIQELQTENARITDEYEAKLKQRDFDFALDGALREAKAKNPKAVKALLDIEAVKLTEDKIDGLEDQLKALKKSDGYLFASDGIRGNTPPVQQGGGKPAITKEQFAQMNIVEKTELFNTDNELYKSLTE